MQQKNICVRKRNRLKNYDYSRDGWYFVTICADNVGNGFKPFRNSLEPFPPIATNNFKPLFFGEIKNDEMMLNKYGIIVRECWLDLPNHYANCQLDEFVIMPNHFHGIVVINNDIGNGLKPFPCFQRNGLDRNGLKPFPTATVVKKTHGLSEIIRGFKTFSSKCINGQNINNAFKWQKSFYDHVIRDEKSLNNIREYIQNNPLKWALDRNNIGNGL